MLLIILISKLDFYFSSFLSVSHQCSFIIYFLYKYSTHPFIFLLFRIFYSETKYIFSFKVLENLEDGLRRTEYPQNSKPGKNPEKVCLKSLSFLYFRNFIFEVKKLLSFQEQIGIHRVRSGRKL